MFHKLLSRRTLFHKQTTRCTICLRPTQEETVLTENLVQGHYVCPTCQQTLTTAEITRSLQALGLIPLPPPPASEHPLPPDLFRIFPFDKIQNVLKIEQHLEPDYTQLIHISGDMPYYFVTLTRTNGETFKAITYGAVIYTPMDLRTNVLQRPVTIVFVVTSNGLWMTDDAQRLQNDQEFMARLPRAVSHMTGYSMSVMRMEVEYNEDDEEFGVHQYYLNGDVSEWNTYNQIVLLRQYNYTETMHDRIKTYNFIEPAVLFDLFTAVGWVLTDDLFEYNNILRRNNQYYQ